MENATQKLFRLSLDYVHQNRPSDLSWSRAIDAGYFDRLPPLAFLTEYCWVVYAAGFKVRILEAKFPGIRSSFCEFELDKLAQMASVEPVLEVFGNRRKAESFLQGSKCIISEGYEKFCRRLKTQGRMVLIDLPGIGKITSRHLARNIGLEDVAKDDIWLIRIKESLGWATVDKLVAYLADHFSESRFTVDLVLWRFVSDNGWVRYDFPTFEALLIDLTAEL